ncbi:MAG: hypothetical protein U5J63_12335 [Fodinibius sp.]|nr:hypothetical protein [Fodinibius sp.]
MKTCAFLSMDNLDEFECYDHLLFEPLQERGWAVEEVSWRNSSINWNRFDVVVIRSAWDYQQAPTAFLDTLRDIDESRAHLENSLPLVEWNIDKTYLRDLQQKGVEVVPSRWFSTFEEKLLTSSFDDFGTDEIIR